MKTIALKTALLGAALALPQAAAAETLSFAHWVPPQHTLTESTIEPFAEGVSEATSGELDVEVFPGGELGAGPLEQYVRVVQGVADIVWGLQGYTSSQFPRTMIAELPGVVTEDRRGYEVLWDAWEAGLLQDEYPGTKPLALWTSEPNIFIMKDVDVRSPEDLEGLKIRVSGSVAGDIIEALGAIPVQMPAGEIYNALQTGLIDGVVTGTSAVGDFRLDEVANSYTYGAPLGQIAFYVVMNQDRFDSLPEEMQAAVEEHSGRWLSQSAEEGWLAKTDAVRTAITESGDNTVIDLTEDEIQAFAEITLPVTDQRVEEIGAQDVYEVMTGGEGS
ncbi:TRAP transporter substrate-binding protein [Tranquillimonas alkanivorans]|uniref:TRAP-type C4-dicarboxylate transport system, substrate-binding protein n=1 Tax=Tranquillimonas alkanivorans TaxID=441119 RepID=A0A1I5N9L4_9RHOB|nr:TRAP transporter substrate-binding protein [Tranquillimonas alkanivorans]SFP18424.1 TRAP-type C4-dicarboxylate transport system, substrate-binding protein [Tranquillimonas alkanivorans]